MLTLLETAKRRITTVLLLMVILLMVLVSPFNLHAPAAAEGAVLTPTVPPTFTATPNSTPAAAADTATSDEVDTQAQSAGLFSKVEGEPPPSSDVETLDSRLVDIDFEQLTQVIESPVGTKDPVTGEPPKAQSLVLNLFDGVVFTGIVEHVERTSSGHALWGRLDGVELGTMTMVVNGSIVVGTVRTLEAVYSIRTAGDGTYVIRQIDESSLPPLGEPLEASVSARDSHSQADDVPLDDGSEIDVMVVYTPSAKHFEGGRAAIEALIDLFVAETNQAYANSGVIHRIKLVFREQVDYIEDGDSSVDLGRLSDDSDGHMDRLHELRDLYAADLVHLVVGRKNVGGLAYLILDASYDTGEASGFGLIGFANGTSISSPTGLVFAHELGHNMGLDHDRYEFIHRGFEDNSPGSAANFGYVNQRMFEPNTPESARWRTIMAYRSQCRFVGSFRCPRIPYFSNPELTNNGDPMGVPTDNPSTGVDGPADAVGTINDRREITANFRRSSTSATPRVALALSPYWLPENGGTSKVTATLHRPSSADTFVTLSIAPSDAVTLSANGTLTIPARQTVSEGDVTITGIDNGNRTGDVIVTISATPTNGSSQGVIEPEPVALPVADDETIPVVTLSLSRAEILEGEEGYGYENRTLLTATLDNRSSAETTVTVSSSSADIVKYGSTTLTIPAGQAVSDFYVIIDAVDDTEFVETRKIATVSGTARNPQGVTGPESATLTIIDDDAPIFADDSIGFTFTEGLPASRVLPEAAYGNGTLTYSISPSPTNGVTFSAGPPARIGITETSVGANQTSYALTATDADGDTDTMAVSITVLEGVCPNSAAVSGYADPRIVQDCEALLAARDALRDDQSLNWSEDLAIDRWQGVSIVDNRVTGITLNALGLMGTIPSELGNLSNLQSLILISNKLTGPIPPELGRLPNLQNLRLSGNELTGMIPVSLGDLYKLRTLDLGHNQLIGEIQVELSNLTELQSLDLGWNELTGGIPVWIGELSSLRSLDLNGNELTGEIPVELSNLTELQSLNLGWNQLKGGIPVWLGSLPRLRSLYLSLNQLTGPIPSGLSGLADLEELGLIGNQLTGQIPPELGELANLQKLRLSSNQLTGPIPAQLGRLTNLQELFLGQNHLTGRIPRELGNLANLTSLYLSGNRLSGCVPAGLRDLTNNDFLQLGLPFCDVLLSGLAIDPGELIPPFDPYRTNYVVLTSTMRITVTPVNENGATFRFLDQSHNEIVDADGSLDGHQIDLNTGVTTISIMITSQDGLATHTYTIQVGGLTVPGAPAISSVTTGVGNLTIVWTAPDDTGRLDIESYDIRYIEAAADETVDSNWTVAEDVWNATSSGELQYAITGLTGETSYDIQVRAENAKGTGPWSETTTGTPADPSVCVAEGAVGDATNTGLVSDCEALLEARDTLAGSGSFNWSETTSIAQWEGVRLGGTPQRITRLALPSKGLDGTISSVLGSLSMLTDLNLRSNALTGEIPGELGNLTNLRVLNLHSNKLSGDIPDLSRITGLEELYLPNNYDETVQDSGLTGPVPSWLNGMTNMRELWLWGNSLTGSIPDLSGMTSLQKLKLANNMLTGGVPDGSMLPPNVTWLIIDRNPLGGTIPDLSELTRLRLLWLHSNQLTGSIPSGDMLPPSVDDLNLRDNMLTGTIPDLSNLDNLTRLRLHNNSLSGEVPATLGGLERLRQLWLHNEVDRGLGNNSFTSIAAGVGGLADTLIEIALRGNSWADDACVPSPLANVAKNDYAAAGLEVCSDAPVHFRSALDTQELEEH